MQSESSLNLLAAGVHQLGVKLNLEQQQQLIHFLALLQRWSRVYNLTAIRHIDDMVTRHLLDSLAIAPFLQGEDILDVGSGAGLPGIPLAVYYPHKRFVLIDSSARKTRFLWQAQQSLQLTNLEVVQTRVETFSPDKCFSTIMARAFASLVKIVQKTQHLCCNKGLILAMKGRYPAQELTELDNLSKSIQVQRLQVPNLNRERHLVMIGG